MDFFVDRSFLVWPCNVYAPDLSDDFLLLNLTGAGAGARQRGVPVVPTSPFGPTEPPTGTLDVDDGPGDACPLPGRGLDAAAKRGGRLNGTPGYVTVDGRGAAVGVPAWPADDHAAGIPPGIPPV